MDPNMDVRSTTPGEEVEELFEELSAMEQAMTSEEHQQEGTFLTGGNTRDFVELGEEVSYTDEDVLTTKPVKDGKILLDFLRKSLHKFDSPHSYIGGEANAPDRGRFHTSEVKILIARLSTYESTSLSMTHSMLAQIFQELPYTFCDLTFLPKPEDYKLLQENGFPAWFGTNTKLAPDKFDVLCISHSVSMEQLNFIPLIHDSGIPLFKSLRMDREDIPILVVGGANSGTTAPLSGTYTARDGKTYAHLIDCVIYGDGEEAAKQLIEVVHEGKRKGWSKREILRACHGRVEGFYEPDLYEHIYDGKGSLKEIRPLTDYAEFPVKRATVKNLDNVRTLETKILPYTGDGASVDVAIAGSVGCIGSGGWGACSFCREGSEGPYRERSLNRVLGALDAATRNQGNKEVSFFSLNFNQYRDFFPLVAESVKKGYKVGLISQRVDMLAETPEQIKVQRWLKKSNYTLGVEGISGRMRAYLNKNLSEWELLKVCTEMMKGGAGELKLFMISTGMETEVDAEECCTMMERVNAIKEKLGSSTRFRISFTPLFPSAYTALQFAPALAAVKHGQRNLDAIFNKAKELGWGRRLSVSGEEPLVSNTINQGGRNIFSLLMDSYFRDNFKFYGSIAKGSWVRWKRRVEADPNIDTDILWGEKSLEYVFPWEDIDYSTSKEVLWRGYVKAVAFQGVTYCLSTRTVKGICVAEDEPVLTQSGFKPIQEVVVGEKVWTSGGLNVVTAVTYNGFKETMSLTTSLGHSVRTTPDHKIFTQSGWKEAKDIRVGEKVRVVVSGSIPYQEEEQVPMPVPIYASRRTRGGRVGQKVSYPQKLDEELAYMYGYFAGDGNLYYDPSGVNGGKVRFCVADHEKKELKPEIVKAMIGAFGLNPGEGYEQRNAETIVYNSTELAHYFAGMNLKSEVPNFIAQARPSFKVAYLRGLFDADGNAHYHQGFQLAQKSPSLMRDVHQLLLTLGIECHVGPGHKTLNLRVHAVSEERFTRLVGFSLKAKADVVVVRGEERDLRDWDEVISIQQEDLTDVWDLTVNENHEFVAGGILVHNCHVNECGACDPGKTGKPELHIITNIVGRQVAPTITADKMQEMARSREKAYHLRVMFETQDPIYRFVQKGYHAYSIPRALMKVSDRFNDAFVGAIGHARIHAGANLARDWTFGKNIFDFSLCEHIPESELMEMIEPANRELREGKILGLRMDSHLQMLRNDVDYSLYTMFVPNKNTVNMSFGRLRDDINRHFERRSLGKGAKIKIKVTRGKGMFKTEERSLLGEDIRQLEYRWEPEYRGTLVRFVISATYNPLSMLEAMTGRKHFLWKEFPIFCDGYVQLPEATGDFDIFSALQGTASYCKVCKGSLEVDLFTGQKHSSGVCMGCSLDQYPVDMNSFFTKELQAIELEKVAC